MRARRRTKQSAKTAILEYPKRIFVDNSTYKMNYRPELKTNLKPILEKYEKFYVEIGSGNGKFLNELAKRNPDTLCIGIELKEERILEAIQEAEEKNIENTLLIRISAIHLDEVFDEQFFDTIFINFPDPWPKSKHEKHRLTASPFLDTYHNILKKDGQIILKTDNPIMYSYSLETLPEKFEITETSENLKDDDENIKTKYEIRYRHEGKPIFQIIAKK
ncbi:tRNA (guanosine(46)-N7)-methyltransferase TrmB [Candidatus Peregrinibacteria bacterium]|jgi:tRNA (guanine-N7-)-methyltransferase|nr:tRNA (guanosine(46)-N7)-methyltransferase TrmB [Candidatus Peregrinibacteria bacterium]